jgi:ABC-type Mn2+/Zn2+ transport system permease subunit
MINAFVASWPLFHNTHLAGWLIGIVLSLIGVLIVARDQIFIGAAVSQASLLGIAVAILLGSWLTLDEHHWMRSDVFHATVGGAFSVVAALFTARGNPTVGRESHEAVTGWIFLLSGSSSILLMSHSPHGLEEVHRLLSSTLIGATRADVWIFAGLTAVTIVALWYYHRPALLIVMDREMAQAVGLRVGWWDTLFSLWLGTVVGFSIHVAGVIYAFASLVLPALIAKNLSREVRSMFFLSPLVALISGIFSFMLANYYDYPPGQMATAILCFVLAVAWFVHYLRATRLLS